MIQPLAIAIDPTLPAPDRVLAIQQLWQAEGSRCEGVLRDLLRDASSMVREAALAALLGPLGLRGYAATATTWLREHPSADVREAALSAMQGYASWNEAGGRELMVDLVEALLEEPDEGVRMGVWDTILRIKRASHLGTQIRRDVPLEIDWGVVSDDLKRVSRKGDWKDRIGAALRSRGQSIREFVESSPDAWFDALAAQLQCGVHAPQVIAALAPSDDQWADSDWYGRLTLARAMRHYAKDDEFAGRPTEARRFALDVWMSFHRRRVWGVEAEFVRKTILDETTTEWLPRDEGDDELLFIFESCNWLKAG